jgi:Raf kinase inhibitor-like YbhB/YbcL family protein
MHVRSNSFRPYHHLDPRLAFAAHNPEGGPASHVRLAGNRNPHLAWSAPPEATRSFALLCFDPEVPTEGSNVNREGVTVPLDLPRADFFHWVLVDLPADLREIAEGSHSDGVTTRGKAPGPSASGGLQGINDYTGWFAGDEAMKGDYGGYDGPCPPWNDERVHAYNFVVYALDVPTLGLSGSFDGHAVRRAMQGHVLAESRITGLYAIYPGAK